MKATVAPTETPCFFIAYGTALSIANANQTDVEVVLGVHSGDHAIYPDCRPEFYTALEHALAIGIGTASAFHLHFRTLKWTRRAS